MENDGLPESFFIDAFLVPKPPEVTIPWLEDVEGYIETYAYSA